MKPSGFHREMRSAAVATLVLPGSAMGDDDLVQGITVVATHLDHTGEPCRLAQMEQLLQQRLPEEHRACCFLMGDFNALTLTDYTGDEWKSVARVRSQSRWEPPKHDLMDALRNTW